MPLVRFHVRNEFRLGQPELYKDANQEDPKAVLDGVAVTGLVGILRQLGDLAEFAAEVFHGLQEQVMTTSCRSHKLMARVQNIEASLPPLEKAIIAQTSHIHFAYTVGSEWHPRIRKGRNHFICNDLPRFIMDSYEECQDPPRLHMLDKFDTGGPGSCLKRYSDPTFFRRVSANSDEAIAEKVQRDKKARKSRKKRSLHSNGEEVSYASSILNQSGRMQFYSPTVKGKTLSQTASTSDLTIKSDLGDCSNSFDSRTGSGYNESMYHPSFSMQPEETEPGTLSFRMMHHTGTSDSIFSSEQSEAVGNDFQHSPPKEKIQPCSSCVTRDEKEEVVNAKGDQECDIDEAPDILPIHCDLYMASGTVTNLTNVDQPEMMFADENNLTSTLSKHWIDEIESEADNYMDALNTIESESDTDFDCQMKREMEQYSEVYMEYIEDGREKLGDPHTDDNPSRSEYHKEPDIFSNREKYLDIPNSVSSKEICNDEQAPQISRFSTENFSHGIAFCRNADISDSLKVESVSDPSCSDSKAAKIIRNFPVVQQYPAELSGVRFWTNGGLLGLEPSKPPDFSISDPSSLSKSDVNAGIMETNPSAKILPSCQDYQGESKVTKTTIEVLLTSEVNGKLVESDDSPRHDKFGGPREGEPNKINARTPETELPMVPDAKATCSETSHENDENTSRVFGLTQKLLVNGLLEKLSLVHDGKPEKASILATGVLEQSRLYGIQDQTIKRKTFMNQLQHGSPLNSVTSSPPLEHMKISFHPINGFETSKLQLKFLGGSDNHERSCVTFPSFQLVPDPAVPLPDIGYDSDNDTFCRSSPCLSDDCLSNCSKSNSEQWESGDTPGSKEQELYAALGRMSSMESVSSSLEISGTSTTGILGSGGIADICTENGSKPSCTTSDLSSSYSMNPVHQDTESDYHRKNSIELLIPGLTTNALSPPLPPVQWRVSKNHMVAADDQEYTAIESSQHALNSEPLGSTLPEEPMLGSANLQEANEQFIVIVPESKQQELQKSNGQKEASLTANPKILGEKEDFHHQISTRKLNGQSKANLVGNDKRIDETEDFLRQIKSKSFNLRHTVTPRPTYSSGTATNIKVNAILEKANAIRQAVGSDDGEDDTWSDT